MHSTTDLDVVAADPGKAATVFAMVRELAAHEGSLDAVTSSEQRWCDMLADPDVIVLIAVDHGAPVGFVSAVRRLHLWSGDHIVALDDIYVRPGARNKRVGEALMRALAVHAGTLPIRWEVEEGNVAGQRFSLRLGARLRRKVIAVWTPSARAS